MIKNITLLTVDDVKRMVGVSSTATIYNYMLSGILPFRQIGKNRRFTTEDIQQFLENCKTSNKPSKRRTK